MSSYQVFTVRSGNVVLGASIDNLHIKSAKVDVPAVIIGEEGRGRQRGVVPVANPPNTPCLERGKDVWTSADKCEKCGVVLGEKKEGSYTRSHPDLGMVRGRLMFAELGQTKAGKPKFFAKDKATSDEKVIVVFDTKIGYRGGNEHTGDRVGWSCRKYGCEASCDGIASELPEKCPECGAAAGSWDGGPKLSFAKFPGLIITQGRIAQGDAGRAGSGEQIIAIMPKDVVFRTAYFGRLYGAPGSHYYMWDGARLLAATWEERACADLF